MKCERLSVGLNMVGWGACAFVRTTCSLFCEPRVWMDDRRIRWGELELFISSTEKEQQYVDCCFFCTTDNSQLGNWCRFSETEKTGLVSGVAKLRVCLKSAITSASTTNSHT